MSVATTRVDPITAWVVAGALDSTLGGPDIDHHAGLTVPRRSLYFRHAAEKQMEFLRIFDAAGVTECYRRKESILPEGLNPTLYLLAPVVSLFSAQFNQYYLGVVIDVAINIRGDYPELLRNENWNYAIFTTAKQYQHGVNQAECLACHKPLSDVSYTFTLKQLSTAK